MRNILNSIKLDYYTSKANYKLFAAAYMFAILLGVLRQPALAIVVVMVFSVSFSGMVFSLSEKNNLNRLYGILPLKKSEAVIGRYLYALLCGVINGTVSIILVYIISIFSNKATDTITFATYLSASFLYYCLAIGVSFPIYFKFGFSKAYIFTMLPMYIVFIGFLFITKKTNFLNNLKQIIDFYTSNQYMIWVTGIGLGLILFIISCSFACLVYKKSEL